jgi:ethanolamine-phosphate cytidylyltransferase
VCYRVVYDFLFCVIGTFINMLTILRLQYVDEVIIGAPYVVTEALINNQNISYVFHGSVIDVPSDDAVDPYEVISKNNIF